jgi:NTE family protein
MAARDGEYELHCGARRREQKNPIAVAVLGAGAPHAGLLAGALAYIHRKTKKTFDLFFTSGGGALIGLLFVAPKGKAPDEALREVAEFGVDERIYRFFPVGYKTFFKDSPYLRQFQQAASRFKLKVEPRPFPGERPPAGYDPREQRRRRYYNDWVDFWFSALTPSTLSPRADGLCAHLPFLEDLVDFSRETGVNRRLPPPGVDFLLPVVLPAAPDVRLEVDIGWFYVNAYNLSTAKIEQFTNSAGLTPTHIKAALSFPLVYPPQKVGSSFYCEGADVDPLNLPNLADVIAAQLGQQTMQAPNLAREVKPRTFLIKTLPDINVYVFDILDSLEREIVYTPKSLWDAYGLSILTPVVSLAGMSRKIFERGLPPNWTVRTVTFDIPKTRRKRPLDWSYPNTTALWDAGWEAGRRFVAEHGHELPDRADH